MNVRELIDRLRKEDPTAVVIFTFAEHEMDEMAANMWVEINNVETGDGHEGNEVWIGA